MVSIEVASQHQVLSVDMTKTISPSGNPLKRIKRKPPPVISPSLVDLRYPSFDVHDPFTPLSDLRKRSASLMLGESTPFDQPESSSRPSQKFYLLSPDLTTLPDGLPCNFPISSDRYASLSSDTIRAPCHIATVSEQKVKLRYHSHRYEGRQAHSLGSLMEATSSSPAVLSQSPRLRPTSYPVWMCNSFPYSPNSTFEELSPTSSLSAQSYIDSPYSSSDASFVSAQSQSGILQILMPNRSRGELSNAGLDYPKSSSQSVPSLPTSFHNDIPFPRGPPSTISSSIGMPAVSRHGSVRGSTNDHSVQMGTDIGQDVPIQPVRTNSRRQRDRRNSKAFSFSSISFIKSKVDIVEHARTRRKSSLFDAPLPPLPFDEHALPTPQQISEAANLSVIGHDGVSVRFGKLFEGQHTIVLFIRHFWCPSCQDYIRAVASETDVDDLAYAGIRIVVVGIGSPTLIKPYNQVVGSRFALYTDPSLTLHRTLGMTLKSTNPGPDAEKGEYAKQRVASGVRRLVVNALARLTPVFNKAGDVGQLGGEFVLGPGLTCSFAHRMTTTRSHLPIRTIISATGVDPDRLQPERQSWSSAHDEDAWMEKRRQSWVRIRERKRTRQAGDTRGCEVKSRFQGSTGSASAREHFTIQEEGDLDEFVAWAGQEGFSVTQG